MPLFDVNSLTNGEIISHTSGQSLFSRHFITEHLPYCRRWLVANKPETYMSSGPVASHQTQTARKGDYCHMDDSSEEEEEEDEATSSDEEFVVKDDDASSSDEDYTDSETSDSKDEDSE